MNLLKSEFLKLVYQRRTYGLMLVSILIASIAAVAPTIAMTRLPVDIGLTLSSPAAIDSVYAKALGGYLFVVILGVYMMSSEFNHHTAIATFLATPKRSRALGAKLLMAAIAGAIINLIATGFGLLAGKITLDALKVTTQPDSFIWLDYPVAALLIGAVLGVIGVSIGTLIRNQNAAVTTAMVWLFLVDRLLALLWSDIGKYLPTGLITAMMNLHIMVDVKAAGLKIDTTQYLEPLPASALLLTYGLVFAAIAMFTSLRRDID